MASKQWKRGAAAALASFVLALAASAQNVGPGLQWIGTAGSSASSFTPSCTPLSTALQAGESVTLTVWGDRSAPFGLLASTGTSPCVTFPGIGGGLLLASPLVTVGAGTLTQISPCLACPQAFSDLTFTVPRGLPVGLTFAVQALTLGGRKPAFSVAIVASS